MPDSPTPLEAEAEAPSLKLKTARTLKWNTIDRVSTQILYAVVGVVLANILPVADFGLVGLILMFQAFAVIFVDSGFGAALLQKKEATQEDYSTIFWFNLIMSLVIYTLLWFAAPAIAGYFHSPELLWLSREMFLTFIFTALGVVQTNQLMKKMEVKQIAVSNFVGMIVSSGIGIGLALGGYGVHALVWQYVSLAATKTGWLWLTGKWRPSAVISRRSFSQMWRVGLGVFSSSFLNTLCQYLYTWLIGRYFPITTLAIYSQADKWSKMGSASLSGIMTASFVPMLSRFHDDAEQFRSKLGKINRFAAFITFPLLGGMAAMATPLFHTLFGEKWDAAIPLFQILCLRGIFVTLTSLCTNYLLSLGRSRKLVESEIVKDGALLVAALLTLPTGSVEIMVWGMTAASVLTSVYVLAITASATRYSLLRQLRDLTPYFLLTAAICALILLIGEAGMRAWITLTVDVAVALGLYIAVLRITGSAVLADALDYLLGRFRRR